MADPRDGVPFTGFSPTLGPVANANSTEGTVQYDALASAASRAVRIGRQRASYSKKALADGVLGAADAAALLPPSGGVVAKSALFAPYDLGGLVEIEQPTPYNFIGVVQTFNLIDSRLAIDIDWSNAFNRIFNVMPAVGSVIYVPPGNLIVGSPLICLNKAVTILGASSAASIITQTHTGVGLLVAPIDVLQRVCIRGVAFVPNAAAICQRAIEVVYPPIATGPVQTVTLHNIEISSSQASSAAPYAGGYKSGVRISGAWQADLYNIRVFLANVGNLATSYGIEIARSFNTIVINCNVSQGEYGVYVTDYAEFILVSGCSFVGCSYGMGNTVAAHPVNSFYGLSWYITHNEFDCLFGAFTALKIKSGWVHDNHFGIRSDGNYNVVVINDCQNFIIHDNNINGVNASSVGVRVSQTNALGNRNQIHNNTLDGLAKGVVFDALTRFNRARDNQLLNGVTVSNAFEDNGGDNTNMMQWVASEGVDAGVKFTVKAGVPTTADVPSGTFRLYKDASGGSLRLWANDGGTMKSVTLT